MRGRGKAGKLRKEAGARRTPACPRAGYSRRAATRSSRVVLLPSPLQGRGVGGEGEMDCIARAPHPHTFPLTPGPSPPQGRGGEEADGLLVSVHGAGVLP